MERQLWRVRCTATRTRGGPCGQWAITGGYVCWHHGGAAPQVKAAAARRWERELMFRKFEADYEREHGEPLDPFFSAYIRYRFSADPATWRRHRRTRPLAGADATNLMAR